MKRKGRTLKVELFEEQGTITNEMYYVIKIEGICLLTPAMNYDREKMIALFETLNNCLVYKD